MSIYPQILGVYSLAQNAEVGAGGTRGQYAQVTYWFARRLSDDEYEVQALNANHVPSGVRSLLGKNDFVTAYTPEPSYYERHTQPALKSLAEKIRQGEEAFAKGNLDKAEQAFLKALMIDELNVPANLGVGAVYTEKGEFKKVKKVLDILLNQDETFRQEQRQSFNRLGMGLRKQGLLGEALAYFQKALELHADDENLHFNLARVHFDRGDHVSALEHIRRCLDLNPDLDVAKKFLRYCEKQMNKA
ncbi:tetratricopeptide repeat protein [Desulfocurvus sp. DL9XJH121]